MRTLYSHVQAQAVPLSLWSKAVRLAYLDQVTLQDYSVRCKGRPSVRHDSCDLGYYDTKWHHRASCLVVATAF